MAYCMVYSLQHGLWPPDNETERRDIEIQRDTDTDRKTADGQAEIETDRDG